MSKVKHAKITTKNPAKMGFKGYRWEIVTPRGRIIRGVRVKSSKWGRGIILYLKGIELSPCHYKRRGGKIA